MTARLLAVLVMVILMSGCATPLLEYQLESPAAAIIPIEHSSFVDERSRFREIFCQLLEREDGLNGEVGGCNRFLLQLGDEPRLTNRPQPLPEHDGSLRFLIVPGALGECFGADAQPYPKAVQRLRELGYRIEYIRVGGRSGTAHNAGRIAEELRTLEFGAKEKLVLVGYSKGASDILHFLAAYPDLASKVTAVLSIAGSINGSPLADRYEGFYDFWLSGYPFDGCGMGDGQVVKSLQRTVSMSHLATQPLIPDIRYFSLGSFTENGKIARIMSVIGYPDLRQVDPRNDGQTLYFDQVIPGAVLLGYANADHWAVAIPMEEEMPFFAGHQGSDAPYPRDQLFEAMVLFLVESLAERRTALSAVRPTSSYPQNLTHF